jgi:hypothetical protein
MAIWVGDRPATVLVTGTSPLSSMSCIESSVGWIPMVTFLVEAGLGSLPSPGEARHSVDPEPKWTLDDSQTLFGAREVTV